MPHRPRIKNRQNAQLLKHAKFPLLILRTCLTSLMMIHANHLRSILLYLFKIMTAFGVAITGLYWIGSMNIDIALNATMAMQQLSRLILSIEWKFQSINLPSERRIPATDSFYRRAISRRKMIFFRY